MRSSVSKEVDSVPREDIQGVLLSPPMCTQTHTHTHRMLPQTQTHMYMHTEKYEVNYHVS